MILGLYRGNIGENGKENGNYHITGLYRGNICVLVLDVSSDGWVVSAESGMQRAKSLGCCAHSKAVQS